MLTDTAPNPFWFIAGCAGLGAFLDFWIGKKGQKKTKDWLELHWYHFVDVDVRNFAAEESLRCICIFDKLFGARLLSWRRLASTMLVLICAFGAFALLASRHDGAYATLRYVLFEDSYAGGTLLSTVVVLPILFALSLSLTKHISVMAIRVAGTGRAASSNIIVFVALVLIHYEMLTLWGPLFRDAVQMSAPYAISADLTLLSHDWARWANEYVVNACQLPTCVMKEVWPLSKVIGYLQHEPPYIGNGPPYEALALSDFFTAVFNLLANGTRIGLAFVFILLWLTLPLLRGPLLTLWARLVESERPVFTLVFGGVASIGSAMEAVVKYLF